MKSDVLGVKVHSVSMADAVEKITEAVDSGQGAQVVTANPELIYFANKDPRLKQLINSAYLVTADGVGVVWAAKKLGFPVPERVTGIDLIEALFPVAGAKKWRIFFLGSKPGVAEKAAQKVAEKYPDIQWQAHHGYFNKEEEAQILEQIRSYRPHLLLIGLGAPRQEFWLFSHRELPTISIGVGGSFDALSGANKRAPQWIQNIHLEWLYRLLKQPSRWKRQLVLPRFAWRVLRTTKEKARTSKVR